MNYFEKDVAAERVDERASQRIHPHCSSLFRRGVKDYCLLDLVSLVLHQNSDHVVILEKLVFYFDCQIGKVVNDCCSRCQSISSEERQQDHCAEALWSLNWGQRGVGASC